MTDVQERVVALVAAGASIDEAARQAGASVASVRRWLTEGRKDPDGARGAFAAAVDEARAAQRVALRGEPMTHEEIERLLTAAIRAGSLQAVKLWLALHPKGEDDEDDVLADFVPASWGRT